MTVFVVAALNFTDEARYRMYQARFAQVFAGSGGRLLAADEAPRLLEGSAQVDKVVLMQFASEAAARAFLESPAYQEISADRRAGAQTTALLVRGLDPAT